ncbi:MAG: hypothetical protein ACTSQA_03470 [Candidatus Heimdallarchaeaceae archaeon]
MGRTSTGARTTASINRIELKLLFRDDCIKEGQTIRSTISWTDNSIITIETYYSEGEGYVRLMYTNTTRSTGKKTEYDYKIHLTSLPSNLGNGCVPYFQCPVTYELCRVLYLCYGSETWKSREAYQKRIYYNCQITCKTYYHNTRYWTINTQLEKLYKQAKKKHYRGVKTKLQQRIWHLENKQWWHNERRWILPKRMQAIIGRNSL